MSKVMEVNHIPKKSYEANFVQKGYAQDMKIIKGLLIVIGILLIVWALQVRETRILSQDIEALNQELTETRLTLTKTNAAWDWLSAEHEEMRKVVSKEPWLKLEWELKNNPDQVRGVDGKFTRERL